MIVRRLKAKRSKRHDICRLSVAVFGVLMGVLVATGCGRSEQTEQPEEISAIDWRGEIAPNDLNIVLITIDTLRSDRVSSYGSDLVDTPNIDSFASDGVLFSNAASTVPFTLPAHSSILTGLYPPGHGVRENVGYTLDDSIPTLAEVLSEGGWNTAGFVSAFVLDRRWGIGRGFDHYFDDFDLAEFDTANLSSVQRSGDVTIGEAVRWIDGRPQDAPFFLWLHLYDPHDPYTPPEPFKSMYPNRPYEGEVAYTDSLIGEFRRRNGISIRPAAQGKTKFPARFQATAETTERFPPARDPGGQCSVIAGSLRYSATGWDTRRNSPHVPKMQDPVVPRMFACRLLVRKLS